MKNFDELSSKICACEEALNSKLDGSNGKRAILLCGGTGCISSNSLEIKDKFQALIDEKNMNDKVTVNILRYLRLLYHSYLFHQSSAGICL